MSSARQALAGTIVSGVFGLAWGQWAADGLPRTASLIVRIASTVIGITIAARAARLRRATTGSGQSMFGSTAYRVVVVGEIIAVIAGAVVLDVTEQAAYIAAWVAAVVAVHFAGFGILFDRFFFLLAAGLFLAAATATIVGLAGADKARIDAVTGLVAAVTLFAGGIARLIAVGSPERSATP